MPGCAISKSTEALPRISFYRARRRMCVLSRMRHTSSCGGAARSMPTASANAKSCRSSAYALSPYPAPAQFCAYRSLLRTKMYGPPFDTLHPPGPWLARCLSPLHRQTIAYQAGTKAKGPGNFRYTDIAGTRGCNPLSTTDHRLFIKGVLVNAKSLNRTCCSHASFTEPDCSTVVSFTWFDCSGFATHGALAKPAYRLSPARPLVTTLRLSRSPNSPTILPRPFFSPVGINPHAFASSPPRCPLSLTTTLCLSRG